MAALITKKTILFPIPGDDDRRAYDQRIKDALALDELSVPLALLKRIPAAVNAGYGAVSCIIGRTGRGYRLIDIGKDRSYGLALDLGSTNLVIQLVDMLSGDTLLTRSFENPQIIYGSDILTRMQNAMSSHGSEVYQSLRNGINNAIRAVCDDGGIDQANVHGLVAAGNTVMSHFFLGLDISTIPVAPFVPVVRRPGFFTAAELSLDLHPDALVYVFPNAGSYVGGDIVAGILASGIHQAERASVLIDVGTNAEIVIGNREWMLAGAGAAGPALEEGISRIGRRASRGIIYEVAIAGASVTCKTFDGLAPEGICGSGMVSLLYALYQGGIIDQSGVLDRAKPNVTFIEGEAAYAIACKSGPPLLIRQNEIQNFMKSKAAMFTLLLVLARSVGIGFRDIGSVFVSGALGTGIDAHKAAAIGMLPAWPPGMVHPLGNTSLRGAAMLLTDADLLDTIDRVADRITYKHMHDDPEFMKEFLGAVFIPHTNPELLSAV